MDGLFESLYVFLHDHLPSSWFDNAQQHFGSDLTDDMIVQSVQEASEFFNMNAPMNIHEDWTTGVMTGLTFTENDDILVFNRQQMHDMGITDKEGFDLVMTHEGAHRKLQGIDTGFNAHQEELCCDYMAGVRAGLNGMEEGKLEASLAETTGSSTHPDGAIRVDAIEEGVAFAHDYMESHHGTPPTFSECLEHFGQTDVYASTLPHEPGHINLRPEHALAGGEGEHPQVQHEVKGYTQSDVDWYEHQARISSGSEQAHWLEKARWASSHIHGFADADVSTSDVSEQEMHEFHHGGQYGNATGDYWDDSHPVEEKQGGIKGLFIDNKAAQLEYAQKAKENAEWHDKRANDCIARGDLAGAKDHARQAAACRREQEEAIAASKKCTK